MSPDAYADIENSASHAAILQKILKVPNEPGVYLMKDASGHVIYVGKAAGLKKRLQSYFARTLHRDPKTEALVQQIVSFEIILAASEKEALILESTLIKRYKPRYNVILKDDKRYPCLRLDVRHPYPNFRIVRNIKKDGARYFGPFASAGSVRQSLKIVDKTFKLRKCKDKEFKQRTRPCLHYQMHWCWAPCCLPVEKARYDEQVKEAVCFLNGRTPDLIKTIQQAMAREAEQQNYEKAAVLRDKIFALEKTLEKQMAISPDQKDRDVVAFAASETHSVITILYIRSGFLLGTRHFSFEKTMSSNAESLTAFVLQYYEKAHFIPTEILLSHDPEDKQFIMELLCQLKGSTVRILFPQRGEKRRLIRIALENAANRLKEVVESSASEMNLLLRLQQRLKLERLPERIECFDNSHLVGKAPVSAMVAFHRGSPEKKAYRTFKIKTAHRNDDYASMAEVLKRRYSDTAKHGPPPDLIMVDGGKGQLNIALNVLNSLGLDRTIETIGIAKKDERKGEIHDKIYLKQRANPVSFGREQDLLLFLQKIRDEAHRFVITFHRKQLRKSSLRSALDDIPGIGSKRKAELLRHFGGIRRIREASLEALASLSGMNRDVAKRLKDALNRPERCSGSRLEIIKY
jgi:excinuclease ABC subunit C